MADIAGIGKPAMQIDAFVFDVGKAGRIDRNRRSVPDIGDIGTRNAKRFMAETDQIGAIGRDRRSMKKAGSKKTADREGVSFFRSSGSQAYASCIPAAWQSISGQ